MITTLVVLGVASILVAGFDPSNTSYPVRRVRRPWFGGLFSYSIWAWTGFPIAVRAADGLPDADLHPGQLGQSISDARASNIWPPS